MRMRKFSASPFFIRAVLTIVWMCFGTCGASASSPIIAAYQEIYRMNFEVFQQTGLPSGWFVTSDGYLVAQVRANHWVYGNAPNSGTVVPTEVAVGAVVPMSMPQLARVETPLWDSGVYETEQFMSITRTSFDNMGVLDDPFAYTPIAWKSGEAGFRIWLGDTWHSINPMGGQSSAQAFSAWHPYIARTLREKRHSWSMADTMKLEDLAREWGFLWRGNIHFSILREYRDTGSDGTMSAGGGGADSPGSTPGGSPGDSTGGGWDDGGNGNDGGGSTGGPGGGGGGGWDD